MEMIKSKLPRPDAQPEAGPAHMDLLGASLEEARREFGAPMARGERAGESTWMYDDFMIVSADGKTITQVILEKDFEPVSRKLPVKKSGPPLVTNHADAGKPVELSSLMTNGYINIVSFYCPSNPKSRALCNDLTRLTREFRGVVLRKVNVVTEDSRCARQHGVERLPDARIYDARGDEVGRTTSYSGAHVLVRKALPTLPPGKD